MLCFLWHLSLHNSFSPVCFRAIHAHAYDRENVCTTEFISTRMLSGIAVCFFLTFAGFKVVVPEDPYAMLSDTYLDTLKNDDDIANEAARKVHSSF